MDPMDYTMDSDEAMLSQQSHSPSRCPYRPAADNSHLNFHYHQQVTPHPSLIPPQPFQQPQPTSNLTSESWENFRDQNVQTQAAMNLLGTSLYQVTGLNGIQRQDTSLNHVSFATSGSMSTNYSPTQSSSFEGYAPGSLFTGYAANSSFTRSGVPGAASGAFNTPTGRRNANFNSATRQQPFSGSTSNVLPPLQTNNNYIPNLFSNQYHSIQRLHDRPPDSHQSAVPVATANPPNTTPHSHYRRQATLTQRSPPYLGSSQGIHTPNHRPWSNEDLYGYRPDPDSDDDSHEAQDDFGRTEAQQMMARREVRIGIDRSPQRNHERATAAIRRAAIYDMEGHEISLERARAARRAAAAAQKMVASSAAIATLKKVDISGFEGEDKTCIICYNEFGVKNPDGLVEIAVQLPKCKHIFGDHCLKQWLRDSDSCPYCRDKLPSEPKRIHPDHIYHSIGLDTSNVGVSWGAQSATDRAVYMAAMDLDRSHGYTAMLQNRMSRASAEVAIEEQALRLRRIEADVTGQLASNLVGTNLRAPDDIRRRFRPRPLGRNHTQQISRAAAGPSSRTTRSTTMQSGSARNTPLHSNSSSIDESTTLNQRSITPHPMIVTSSPQGNDLGVFTPSPRPASLPSSSSPLREVTSTPADQQNQGNISGSGGNFLPTPMGEGDFVAMPPYSPYHSWTSHVLNHSRTPNNVYRYSHVRNTQPTNQPEGYGERLAPYMTQQHLEASRAIPPEGFQGRHQI